VHCQTISYGINEPADWMAKDITYDSAGCASFLVENKTRILGEFTLKIPGKHNVYNALASIVACDTMGVPSEKIKDALLHFGGTHRRFEVKGKTTNQATIVDDYAHHPTEIKATITAALNYPHNRIWCIYQPHTYTRTKKLFNEFTEAFDGVDFLILADIYAAREKNTGDISSGMLADSISKKGLECMYMPEFDKIADYVRSHSEPGDLIITMGAGDIYKVGEALLK